MTIKRHPLVIDDMKHYRIWLHAFSNYEIERRRDCASVFLQGEDARIFDEELCLAIDKGIDLDNVCQHYDDVMVVDARALGFRGCKLQVA